jgi:hypothetical protein
MNWRDWDLVKILLTVALVIAIITIAVVGYYGDVWKNGLQWILYRLWKLGFPVDWRF